MKIHLIMMCTGCSKSLHYFYKPEICCVIFVHKLLNVSSNLAGNEKVLSDSMKTNEI